MALHDTHYKHWEGRHLGIWSRRAVIAGQGLKSCLQVRWMRYIVTLCWASALLQVFLLFFLGQLLVADSIVVKWLSNLNPRLQAVGAALTGWLEQHPEISVRTSFNLLFYYFTSNLLTLTMIAIAISIPHLITRDLSSNAIIVYSSKAIGRFDYLLGKFATVVGLMVLTWLGPACAAWFTGNLLSPNWHFFWHSRLALGHTLLYLGSSMAILGILALGVSAISSRAKATTSLWVAMWLVGNALIPIAHETKPWLKHLSFSYNLEQLGLAVFQIQNDFRAAEQNIPFFGDMIRTIREQSRSTFDAPNLNGALLGLGAMMIISIVIIVRKVKPE
ncbi:MAG: hypothetical protein O2960_08805 [Verrucomicrobia bacterium]|nr:hypothetical protein [Verrucomicrobiota bacterium]